MNVTLSPAAIDLLVDENARLRRWLTMSVEERIVDLLVSTPGEGQADGTRKLVRPPSRRQMAETIGCCREQACRVVARLRRRGELAFGRMEGESNRPIVVFLSPALLVRAERALCAR